MDTVLDIEHLSTHFKTEEGVVRAVDDVSLQVRQGEIVCIVGESGSGKSITAMSVMGLVEAPAGQVVGEASLSAGRICCSSAATSCARSAAARSR